MSRRAKYLIVLFALLLLLGAGSASFIGYFNEERIRQAAIEQLDEILGTKVEVESIEFSLLRRFPKASIQFRNVSVAGLPLEKKKNVLKAGSVFLEFDLFDLLTGTYIIDHVMISDAEINVVQYKDGSDNYNFFREESDDAALRIDLEKVTMYNSSLHFENERNNTRFHLKMTAFSLSGRIGNENYGLIVSSESVLKSFTSDQFQMPKNRRLDFEIVLKVKNKENLYSIQSAIAEYDKINIKLRGSFKNLPSGNKINLNFSTGAFDIHKAYFLLSDSVQKKMSRFDSRGMMEINGSLQGVLTSGKLPFYEVNFALSEGSLTDRKYNLKVDSLEFEGMITNGELRNNSTSLLVVDTFSFRGKYGRTTGKFGIINFDKPFFNTELNSITDLGFLKDIINNDSIESMSGVIRLSVKAETFLDSISVLQEKEVKSAIAEGFIQVESGQLRFKTYRHSVDNVNATCHFGRNKIIVDSLSYSIAGITSIVSGELHNFMPYLLFDNQTMFAEAEISYPDLDLNAFLSNVDNDKKMGFILPISEFIVLNLKLNAGAFAYKDFRASDVTCRLTSKYPALLVEDISLSAMEGKIEGWMSFDIKGEKINCASGLQLHRLNIQELFRQFRNFGQDVILDKNLKGYAEADIEFKSSFSRNFDIDQKSIEAICGIEVRNGELIGFAPVLGLSKYVDVEELRHIRFSKLVNEIEIRDRMVYIPEMEIKSTALELSLSGKHSFENEIDYHFRLFLNDILFKKAKRSKKNQEEFGDVEVDESGRAKLFIRMTGTTDKYDIKLDKKALREKWKSDLEKERKELRNAFNSEFGGKKSKGGEAPAKFSIEWEEYKPVPEKADSSAKSGPVEKDASDVKKERKDQKKKKSGDMEDEYEEYDAEKFDD